LSRRLSTAPGVTLATLGLRVGTSYGYVFDLGDDWRHRCEVQSTDVDAEEEYGHTPRPAGFRSGAGDGSLTGTVASRRTSRQPISRASTWCADAVVGVLERRVAEVRRPGKKSRLAMLSIPIRDVGASMNSGNRRRECCPVGNLG